MSHPHLLPLQVVLPLMAAAVAAILPGRRSAALWTIAVTWVGFGISLLLLSAAMEHGPVFYAMGNWEPPIGIQYRVDLLSGFVLVIVSGIAAVTSIFSLRSVEAEIAGDRHGLFYAVFLLCYTGLVGIVITNDAFNIYVFLEISSLATYALIAMGRDRRALFSAIEYLILGTIGATFYLIGLGLLYMATGTLKAAIFPLHFWLTNAYPQAPSFVSSFLAASATKVAIYVMFRLVFTLFGTAFAFDSMPLAHLLMILGVLGILTGSLTAIFQQDVKRLLAYSSVAQIGYIILGLGMANADGLTGGLVHLLNHAVAKAALFMVAGAVVYAVGRSRLEDFQGMGRVLPWSMGAFVLAGMSLMGVPGTAGFITKWYLVSGAVKGGHWLVAVVLVLSSILAVVYVWRVVEVIYFRQRPAHWRTPKPVPASMQLPAIALAILGVVLGVYTRYSSGTAVRAVEYLMSNHH